MDIFLGLFLCFLGSLLKVNIQNRDIFWGCKNFKYFLGCLKFLLFFGGERKMLGTSLRMQKN